MDQFLDPETDANRQFLDPETDKNFQFLDKNLLDPETDVMEQFLGPETDIKHQFLDPETDIKRQFLVDHPETDIMGERTFMTIPSVRCRFSVVVQWVFSRAAWDTRTRYHGGCIILMSCVCLSGHVIHFQ